MRYIVSKVKVKEITSNLVVEGYVLSLIDDTSNEYKIDVTNFLNGSHCLHVYTTFDIESNSMSNKVTLGRSIGLTSTCETIANGVIEDIIFKTTSFT